MSLQAPILPQVQDGNVHKAEVENGLIIQIPQYDNAKTDDMAFIMLNDSPVGAVSVTDVAAFPLEYTINREFTINEKNSVYYVINDELSPSAEFTVIGFTISITATSGAAANGVSTNQVEVSIDNNDNPGSEDSVLLTIVGSSALKRKPAIFDNESPIFSNRKNSILVTTDKSGKATAVFTSLTPGNVIIVATFQQKIVGTISSFVDATDSYPKLLGVTEAVATPFISIADFLPKIYLTAGHEYKAVFSPPIPHLFECNKKMVYSHIDRICTLDHPDSFHFYDEGMDHFTVLESDFGDNLYTSRYGFTGDLGSITIKAEIWDYGESEH
ncbi:hypothetical protein [Klebsiella sp. BIGb0407]|uniref:hypothetical protein n=1 Tax=Klebsiella sp. BIGb0407 TaxID=2940603 RepID=UPI002167D605|nr:hypothetical protein [Klebsiella sp. BIGb0407]MCS3432537.1 hypothetical protein [Klebsiella sp. BIGb0407]